MKTLKINNTTFNIPLFNLKHQHQNIVHIINPELKLTLPKLTIIYNNSHTSTHNTFNSLTLNINTSKIKHILTTQTLILPKPKTYKIEFTKKLKPNIFSKNIILKLINIINTTNNTKHVFKYYNQTISTLSIKTHINIYNINIKTGTQTKIITPNNTTFQYITSNNHPYTPKNKKLTQTITY